MVFNTELSSKLIPFLLDTQNVVFNTELNSELTPLLLNTQFVVFKIELSSELVPVLLMHTMWSSTQNSVMILLFLSKYTIDGFQHLQYSIWSSIQSSVVSWFFPSWYTPCGLPQKLSSELIPFLLYIPCDLQHRDMQWIHPFPSWHSMRSSKQSSIVSSPPSFLIHTMWSSTQSSKVCTIYGLQYKAQ